MQLRTLPNLAALNSLGPSMGYGGAPPLRTMPGPGPAGPVVTPGYGSAPPMNQVPPMPYTTPNGVTVTPGQGPAIGKPIGGPPTNPWGGNPPMNMFAGGPSMPMWGGAPPLGGQFPNLAALAAMRGY